MTPNVKAPDGGFYLQGDQFTLVPDGNGHNVVTVGGNIVIDGAPYIILKSTESAKEFKITVDDQGVVKAEQIQNEVV